MLSIRKYFLKFLGAGTGTPTKRPHWHFLLLSFVSSFCGISLLSWLHFTFASILSKEVPFAFLIGSFGASAVLVFGAIEAPLAQPRNMMLGQLISAFVGMCVAKLVTSDDLQWLAAGLAVSLAIVAMQVTRTTHPPGGATALIAVLQFRSFGFSYLLFPVLIGSLMLLAISLLFNNFLPRYQYPRYWWDPDNAQPHPPPPTNEPAKNDQHGGHGHGQGHNNHGHGHSHGHGHGEGHNNHQHHGHGEGHHNYGHGHGHSGHGHADRIGSSGAVADGVGIDQYNSIVTAEKILNTTEKLQETEMVAVALALDQQPEISGN